MGLSNCFLTQTCKWYRGGTRHQHGLPPVVTSDLMLSDARINPQGKCKRRCGRSFVICFLMFRVLVEKRKTTNVEKWTEKATTPQLMLLVHNVAMLRYPPCSVTRAFGRPPVSGGCCQCSLLAAAKLAPLPPADWPHSSDGPTSPDCCQDTWRRGSAIQQTRDSPSKILKCSLTS